MFNLLCLSTALLLHTVTQGLHDGNGSNAGTDSEPLFTMSLLNTWELSWMSPSSSLLDLDYEEGTGTVRTVSSNTDNLYYFSASDPTVLQGSIDISSRLEWAHGVATTSSGTTQPFIYITDSVYEGDYYRYHNGAWLSYTGNPATEYGMGIEIDESGYLWESCWQGNIFRFAPGSSTFQHYMLEITDVNPEGLTLFPYPGGIGIAIGYQSNKLVEFYLFTSPSTWAFLGSASVPGTFDHCNGLEYVSDRGSFYMLVREFGASGHHSILELSCDIMHLEQDTWGSIKSAFQ